jgi:hypothetical protein
MQAEVYGLRTIEFVAFDSITAWIHLKSGLTNCGHAVMQCLLSADATTYLTNRRCMGPPIRKVLKRALQARDLFKAITRCDLPLKAQDMFSSETSEVLYAITESGIKVDSAANEDSWAYNFVINGAICPSTREIIIGFARGRPHYPTRHSESREDTLNVPKLFCLLDGAAETLRIQLEEPYLVPEEPFNFLETLEFEEDYALPKERCFSYIFAQHNGINLDNMFNQNNVIGQNLLNAFNPGQQANGQAVGPAVGPAANGPPAEMIEPIDNNDNNDNNGLDNAIVYNNAINAAINIIDLTQDENLINEAIVIGLYDIFDQIDDML